MINYARKVNVCFILRGTTLDANNGCRFVKVLTSLKRFLYDDCAKLADSFLLPLINSADQFTAYKLLLSKIGDPAEKLKKKKNE